MWKCVKTNNVKYDNKTLDCGISQWKSWSLDHYKQKDQTKLFRLLWPCLRRLFCSSLFLGFFSLQNLLRWNKFSEYIYLSKNFDNWKSIQGLHRVGILLWLNENWTMFLFLIFFDIFPRIIISGGGTDGVYAFGQP